MVRGGVEQSVAAAGIQLRIVFLPTREQGIGPGTHTRSPGWKPGSMLHANPRRRAAVRLAGLRPLGHNPALLAWHAHEKPRVETRGLRA